MGDFLRFDLMITPILIQILFWLAVLLCLIVGILMMAMGSDTSERVGGLVLFILGPILVRIYSEILIVLFRIHDHLRQIDYNTRRP